MNTIGLIGGVSWESTREYYRMLNEGVRDALGGLHSAKILMHSLDFAEIAAHQHAGRWHEINAIVADSAKALEAAGADAIMICSNLMHKPAPVAEAVISIPLIHIADACAQAILAKGQKKVGLLGAIFTMEEAFYRTRIADKFGIEVIIPEETDRQEVSRVVYEELCQGKFTESSRTRYLEICDKLAAEGAEGIILGCTEIPQLINQSMTTLTLYDTTQIHAQAGLDFLLEPICLQKTA